MDTRYLFLQPIQCRQQPLRIIHFNILTQFCRQLFHGTGHIVATGQADHFELPALTRLFQLLLSPLLLFLLSNQPQPLGLLRLRFSPLSLLLQAPLLCSQPVRLFLGETFSLKATLLFEALSLLLFLRQSSLPFFL